MRGHNFKSGYCLYGDIINTDLCWILLSTFWYLIFLHGTYIIPVWHWLMKNDAVQKVANYKDRASRNYKASSLHMPYWTLHHGTVPVQIVAGYSTLLITATHPVTSVRVIQLWHAWQYSSQSTCVSFSFATFWSASFFIMQCQTWTIYGLWR